MIVLPMAVMFITLGSVHVVAMSIKVRSTLSQTFVLIAGRKCKNKIKIRVNES